MTEHFQDSDCTVVDGVCIVCGVDHSAQCSVCGGRGFHQTDPVECPEIYDPSSPEHVAQLEAWYSYYQPWQSSPLDRSDA